MATSDPQSGAQEPWASNHHPTDRARRHVQDISGPSTYQVVQGGTMDGENCRTPHGVWDPFEQSWESNRQVRMENIGDTDVVNPWLANGRNLFRSLDEIIASAMKPGMSDGEKAQAVFWQETRLRFHYGGVEFDELADPVKVLNVYGCNTCGNDAACMAGLWRRLGLKVAPARLVGHCVTQVFYDGAWHLMDGDMHSAYLLRDNHTVASEADLVRDHDLLKRTHAYGHLQKDDRGRDEHEASLYVYEGEEFAPDFTKETWRKGAGRAASVVSCTRRSLNKLLGATISASARLCTRLAKAKSISRLVLALKIWNKGPATTMAMTLRPGEALTWRWGHTTPIKYLGHQPPVFPKSFANGLWEFAPDFTKETWRKGAGTIIGISSGTDGLSVTNQKSGVVVWQMQSPYPFIGGRLEVDGSGVTFAFSWDGETWSAFERDAFDAQFPLLSPVHYQYYLKCQLTGSARLKRLRIVNDLQMAPLALPGMMVGTNTFTFSDATVGTRQLRITHDWVERSAAQAPPAPLKPMHPADGGESDGTDIVFQWPAAADAHGSAITDYHFELSAYPDMRWPLSMNFTKLNSRTADRGNPRYTLPAPGLLTPDRAYFWRVRAQNQAGVWGTWSPTWSFIPRGPAPPLGLAIDHAEQGNVLLKWQANPLGRKSVKYRIYASDEKGFSVSDEPYPVNIGISQDLSSPFPANFLGETQAQVLEVTGPLKAFYRVVAVDDKGKRSGPSDYCAAPRPFIYSRPPATARVGQRYEYRLAATRSIGDLRLRFSGDQHVENFWDIERLSFTIHSGPAWLGIDPGSGLLSGVPNAAGKIEVVVGVSLERPLRELDADFLQLGREQILATGVETMGAATQRFTIDVAP